tara:strand:- start:72 stop:377 length:306 start_codon:yes stop_codon:yes gene_type:complete
MKKKQTSKKYPRVYIELSAWWGNGDVGTSIRVSRRRWKAIQEGAEYEASSTSWYEGMRYSNGWTFADAKVNINGEDGMQCVVDLPVEELYVNTIINGEYQN